MVKNISTKFIFKYWLWLLIDLHIVLVCYTRCVWLYTSSYFVSIKYFLPFFFSWVFEFSISFVCLGFSRFFYPYKCYVMKLILQMICLFKVSHWNVVGFFFPFYLAWGSIWVLGVSLCRFFLCTRVFDVARDFNW